MTGSAPDWPDRVLNLFPFHHLAAVPLRTFAPVSAAVLTGLGLPAVLAGIGAFERRDVIGD